MEGHMLCSAVHKKAAEAMDEVQKQVQRSAFVLREGGGNSCLIV